jgi:OPA family glycerol-3-phosphate transporter-like MFS transporter
MRQRPAVVLATLIVAYASLYLCRANVDASFPLLSRAFGFTKTELGTLSSISIATYAVGKLVMGSLGDAIGGKRLIAVAMAGSILATFAFGFSNTLVGFTLCASLNRFAQSGGWSGAVSVVAHRFDRRRHGLVMGVLSTSYELGNVVAMLLCSAITSALVGWRPLFTINPLLLCAAFAFVFLMLPAERAAPSEGAQPAVEEASLLRVLRELVRRRELWTIALLSVLLTFLRIVFVTWTPTFLYELSRASGPSAISGSIAKSAIFPAAGVIAALSVGPLTDKLGPGRRAPAMAVSLVVVVGLVIGLAHGGVRSALLAALLIGGVGLFLLGPYSLLAGALALDVSRKRSAATAAGIIDGAGYLGASLAGVVIGRVADQSGWTAALDVVAGAAIAAALVACAWAFAVLRARPSLG